MSPDIRRRAFWRHLERDWRYNVVYPFASAIATIAFPFRQPMLWLWLRRMDLHRWLELELPMPPRSGAWPWPRPPRSYRRWV